MANSNFILRWLESGKPIFAKISVVGINYAFSLVATNLYGADIYGSFTIGLMIMNLSAIISTFGFDTTLLKFGSQALKSGDIGVFKDIYIKAISLVVPLSILVSVVIVVGAETMAVKVFHSPEIADFLRLFALTVLPLSMINLNSEVLKSSGNPVLFLFLKDGSYFLFGLSAIAILFFISSSQMILFWGFIIGLYLAMVVSFFQMNRKVDFFTAKRKNEISFGKLYQASVSFVLASSGTFLKNWSDIFIIGIFLSPREVGIYGLMFKVSKIITIPIGALNAVQAPRFVSLFYQGKISELKKYVQKSTKQIFLFSLVPFLILVLFPDMLIRMFGSGFEDGKTTLIVLSVGFLVNAYAGSSTLLLRMTGHERVVMWITYATLAIGVGLNLLFIPAFGILGAAYTSLVAHALGNGLAGLWANKQLGFNTFFTVSKT